MISRATSRTLVVACLASFFWASTSAAQTPLVALGDEFQVNTTAAGKQISVDVAGRSNGDFVVVWRDDSVIGGQYGANIGAQRFNGAGVRQDGELTANTERLSFRRFPDVAVLDDGRFVVVYESDCCLDGNLSGIHAQAFAANGVPIGTEFLVNTYTVGKTGFPDVAPAPDGGFVVVWHNETTFYGPGGLQDQVFIAGRRYDASLQPLGGEKFITPPAPLIQTRPSVSVAANDSFLVAYTDGTRDSGSYGIFAVAFDGNFTVRSGQYLVNTYTTGDQALASVAAQADNSFIVVWESFGQDGDANGIFGQRINENNSKVGTEFRVNANTVGYQGAPAVAADAGGFVVTWFDNASGGGAAASEVAVRQFTALGVPVGTQFQANQFTTGFQSFPDVANLGPGKFVVTWHGFGYQDGDDAGIFARVFETPGVALCGDANGDGNRTSTDALITLNTGVGSGSCPLSICDVNSTGAINATDALLVLQFGVGQPVTLICLT